MAIPELRINARRAIVPQRFTNTQRRFWVFGLASSGPVLVPTTFVRADDLYATHGDGEGVELAYQILRKMGVVYFVRLPTITAGVLGSPFKAPANIVATTLYGASVFAGAASPNGDVLYTAKVATLTVEHANDGATQTLLVTVTGSAIRVRLATDNAAVVTSTATDIAAAVNAAAPTLVSAVALGNGTGLGAVIVATAIGTNGSIAYLPRQAGATVKHTVVANQALAVSVAGSDITVALATNAGGAPTSTAADVAAAILASGPASLLVTATASGSGLGLAGRWPTAVPLAYGSGAALSLSGAPRHAYRLILECTSPGTVGGTPAPLVRWSADNGAHWSAPQPLPGTGVIVLANTVLHTGITATFTGPLELLDRWYVAAAAPQGQVTDLLQAIDVAGVDGERRAGGLVHHLVLSRADAALVDQRVQTHWETKQFTHLGQARDFGASESEPTWQQSVGQDFLGWSSSKGVSAMCAGHYERISSFSGIQYRDGAFYAVAARLAETAMHEDPGYVDRGGLDDIGEPMPSYLVIAGADANGGVHYAGRVSGVTITHVAQVGNSLPLRVLIGGLNNREITVYLATSAQGVVNSTATQVATAVNAVARHLVVASAQGTGASVAGSTLASVSIPSARIYHDERRSPGLYDINGAAKFCTLRTYLERPGGYYITAGPTFAQSTEGGYTEIAQRDPLFEYARALRDEFVADLNRTDLDVLAIPEGESVPAGALTAPEAAALEARGAAVARVIFFTPKVDGKTSASPYPDRTGDPALDVVPVRVRRDYSVATSRELRMDAFAVMKGIIRTITINITPVIR